MFRFKQFAIRQENAAMKVGTDGTLLGAWYDLNHSQRTLDIGTGTGIIAMMSAQRNPNVRVTAIEIDEGAMLDAQFNVQNCPWPDRIELLHTPLQEFNPTHQFDTIVSNPPFFENSLKTINQSKTTARHTDSLHFSDILLFAQKHLTTSGHLAMILPVENAQKCIDEAQEFGLFLRRKCIVKPVPKKSPHRWAFELSKTPTTATTEDLIIETGKRHDYSADYIKLTNAFYTIM